MLNFIIENLSSIIIGAVILVIIVLIVIKMVRNGNKSFCSCGDCGSCSSCGVCTLNKDSKNIEIKKMNDDSKHTKQ